MLRTLEIAALSLALTREKNCILCQEITNPLMKKSIIGSFQLAVGSTSTPQKDLF